MDDTASLYRTTQQIFSPASAEPFAIKPKTGQAAMLFDPRVRKPNQSGGGRG